MKFRVRLVLCAVLFALAISVKQLMPQGQEKLRLMLFGKGDDPVSQACTAFRESHIEGDPLGKSVAAFCEVLYEKD